MAGPVLDNSKNLDISQETNQGESIECLNFPSCELKLEGARQHFLKEIAELNPDTVHISKQINFSGGSDSVFSSLLEQGFALRDPKVPKIINPTSSVDGSTDSQQSFQTHIKFYTDH